MDASVTNNKDLSSCIPHPGRNRGNQGVGLNLGFPLGKECNAKIINGCFHRAGIRPWNRVMVNAMLLDIITDPSPKPLPMGWVIESSLTN